MAAPLPPLPSPPPSPDHFPLEVVGDSEASQDDHPTISTGEEINGRKLAPLDDDSQSCSGKINEDVVAWNDREEERIGDANACELETVEFESMMAGATAEEKEELDRMFWETCLASGWP